MLTVKVFPDLPYFSISGRNFIKHGIQSLLLPLVPLTLLMMRKFKMSKKSQMVYVVSQFLVTFTHQYFSIIVSCMLFIYHQISTGATDLKYQYFVHKLKQEVL